MPQSTRTQAQALHPLVDKVKKLDNLITSLTKFDTEITRQFFQYGLLFAVVHTPGFMEYIKVDVKLFKESQALVEKRDFMCHLQIEALGLLDLEMLEKLLLKCDIKAKQFASELARKESHLVRRENEVLEIIQNSAGNIQVDKIARYAIALTRRVRGLAHAELIRTMQGFSSQPSSFKDYNHLLNDALARINVQVKPISKPFAIMSLSEVLTLDNDEICSICYESPCDKSSETQLTMHPTLLRTRGCCNKIYHLDCLWKWMKTAWNAEEHRPATCPMCRAEFDEDFCVEAIELKTNELDASS